jgi:predicted lipoprotein with Yx(FWY)xxD motif
MANDLSREEEQRGWRRAYLWVLPLALVLGIAVAVWLPLSQRVSSPPKTGMDETADQQAPTPTGKQALAPARVEVKSSDAYGQYLTDDAGHPLYLFKGDTRGEAGKQAESKCDADCAKSWPPLLSSEAPQAAAPAETSLLGVIDRKDGSRQVTYNGWPLYRYVKDVGPEKGTGNDVKDFGDEWYLVAPSGEEARGSDETPKG